jgi:hypothetical protein
VDWRISSAEGYRARPKKPVAGMIDLGPDGSVVVHRADIPPMPVGVLREGGGIQTAI